MRLFEKKQQYYHDNANENIKKKNNLKRHEIQIVSMQNPKA